MLEKTSLGCPNVELCYERHSNGVPAMPQQLTSEDRAVLAQLLSTNMPKSEIAERLKKHRSTIYRELARNTGALGLSSR